MQFGPRIAPKARRRTVSGMGFFGIACAITGATNATTAIIASEMKSCAIRCFLLLDLIVLCQT